MRIIAGRLKSRNFNTTVGHRTHPMSEKIRGAIFNALGDISGLSVLDVYAGTGALSFEAISRGAASALALDADTTAFNTITGNITALDLSEEIKASRIHCLAWSKRNSGKKFDLVLLDPPYDRVEPKELIGLSKHVKKGGILVLSLPPSSGFRYGESRYELLLQKNYGDAELFFYRRLI